MTSIANTERYARVNRMWPEIMPPLTEQEARAVVKRLWRMATGETFPKRRRICFVTGNRRNRLYWDVVDINVDPHRCGLYGWKWLVHSISHWTWRAKNRGKVYEDHGTGHASHEAWLVHEVVSRGWLEGKLKRPEKVKPPRDLKAERHRRAVEKLAAWQRRKKRAETAIKKLTKQVRYYERQAVTP